MLSFQRNIMSTRPTSRDMNQDGQICVTTLVFFLLAFHFDGNPLRGAIGYNPYLSAFTFFLSLNSCGGPHKLRNGLHDVDKSQSMRKIIASS